MKLTAKAMKRVLILDPAELVKLPEPSGQRVVLAIQVAGLGKTFGVDVAAKAFRKAKATVAEHGAD